MGGGDESNLSALPTGSDSAALRCGHEALNVRSVLADSEIIRRETG